MRTFTNTIIAALALLPAAAHAGEAESDGDMIVVTAMRSETKLSEVGQTISVLDRTLIDQRQTVSVADLLRTTPGVTIARNGGPGGLTSVFIRGAQSEQTVALIDGVKLNDPSSPGGGFNFADLLTDSVERIEILRGPQSVLWGSQAIGGVVNLITRAPTDALTIGATGEYGRYDTGHLTGTVSGRAGPVAFSAGAGYLTTDGISAFDRALGGVERDGYHLFGANAKGVVTLTEAVSVDLRGFYTKSKVDLDGFVAPRFTFSDTFDRSRQEQIVGYAGLNAAIFDGKLKNRFATAYTLIDRKSVTTGRGRNLRFEYQGTAAITGWASAIFGAEHEKQSYRTLAFSVLEKHKANTDSVYGDLHIRPVDGLSVGAGVRYDDHSSFGHATTTSADVAWSPNGGVTQLRASYGEGFKAPSLYQLYGEYVGRANLVPEKAKGWDAGVAQQLLDGAIELTATYFSRKVRDQIDYSFSTGTYDNLARVRARGVELGIRLRPAEGFTVDANYTYTKSLNRERSDANFGKDLARRPRNTVNVSADYAWAFGLATGATVTHVSNSFDDPGNFTRLQGYVLVDLRASFPVTDAVELFGRIENLFDERYQTAFRYGQPGRAAYGGVRLRY